MERTELPVAVFDSGLGGISVLRALVQRMPGEDFLYFGDSANAPYGVRPAAEVRELTQSVIARLYARGIKAAVIACNTATSAAIGTLRAAFSDIPVIGIEPALKPAAAQHRHVLVLATPLTLREEKFAALMQRCAASAEILPLPCPELVEFVERGELDSPALTAYLARQLGPYAGHVDAVVLGCTHGAGDAAPARAPRLDPRRHARHRHARKQSPVGAAAQPQAARPARGGLSRMQIQRIPFPPIGSNMYIVTQGRDAIVLAPWLRNPGNTTPVLLAALSVSRGAPARDFLRGLHLKTETYEPDMTFAERVSLDWGALHIEGYATPGHSRGSACYRIGAQAFFSGDTIVPGCAVITRLRGGDAAVLGEQTVPFLRTLPPELTLYPGHGRCGMTLGEGLADIRW